MCRSAWRGHQVRNFFFKKLRTWVGRPRADSWRLFCFFLAYSCVDLLKLIVKTQSHIMFTELYIVHRARNNCLGQIITKNPVNEYSIYQVIFVSLYRLRSREFWSGRTENHAHYCPVSAREWSHQVRLSSRGWTGPAPWWCTAQCTS